MRNIRWLALLSLLVGCPGDYDGPATDSSGYHPYPDYHQGQLDQVPNQWPDQYVPPPDTYVPPQPDLWYQPPDTGYFGAPFGCQQDSDCFGLKCCETPWGVKLCKEVCQQQ